MILYTMMPQELIFQTQQQDYLKQKLVNVHGVSVLVEENEQGEYQVLRVLSSNPSHFLIESLMPGKTINIQNFRNV